MEGDPMIDALGPESGAVRLVEYDGFAVRSVAACEETAQTKHRFTGPPHTI
jgi:hypothetical protein